MSTTCAAEQPGGVGLHHVEQLEDDHCRQRATDQNEYQLRSIHHNPVSQTVGYQSPVIRKPFRVRRLEEMRRLLAPSFALMLAFAAISCGGGGTRPASPSPALSPADETANATQAQPIGTAVAPSVASVEPTQGEIAARPSLYFVHTEW